MWLDPWPHASTTGYQLLQSLFTIADGGILGRRLRPRLPAVREPPAGRPRPADRLHLRRLANEMGLLGAPARSCSCYLLFMWRGFRIAVWAPDGFSKLLAAGLAVRLRPADVHHPRRRHALIPLTGITLPFVSYGGSSITANLMLVALAAHGLPPHQRGARGHRPRAPTPGRARVRSGRVNKAISRIFIVGVVLFVALIVNLTWIMAVRAAVVRRPAREQARHRQGDEDQARRHPRLRRVGDRRLRGCARATTTVTTRRALWRRSSSATTACATGAAASRSS